MGAESDLVGLFGETLNVYTIVGYSVLILVIVVLILYSVNKFFEIRANKRIGDRSRVKRTEPKGKKKN